MISHPFTQLGLAEKVFACLRSEVADHKDGLMVIHAGHFAIDSAGDHLSANGRVQDGMAYYRGMTVASWEIACATLQQAPGKNVKLMVLVNDWQFLQPCNGIRRQREQQAAAVRRQYYERTPELPHYHRVEMQRRGLTLDQVLSAEPMRILFSETELRHRLQRSLRPIFRDSGRADKLGLRKHFTDKGEPIVDMENDLGGRYCLLFCGSTGCAGEVVELLRELQTRGVTRFINLFPFPCREPVVAGTALARQLFQIDKMRIINIALPLATVDHDAPVLIETC